MNFSPNFYFLSVPHDISIALIMLPVVRSTTRVKLHTRSSANRIGKTFMDHVLVISPSQQSTCALRHIYKEIFDLFSILVFCLKKNSIFYYLEASTLIASIHFVSRSIIK